MKTVRPCSLSLALALAVPPCAARANDCDTIASAMIAQTKVPYATTIETTKPDKSVDHTAAIATGDRMYLQMGGAWQSMPYRPQDIVDQIAKARREAKETCGKVGSDKVDGVAASIFSSHMETKSGNSDARIWIADKSGLPLKSEIHFDSDMSVRQTYRYDNIRPPAGQK